MSKKKLPNEMWAFFANGYGIRSVEPFKVTKEDGGDEWWDKSGNINVCHVGLRIVEPGVVTFVSADKKETELFAKGFVTCKKMLLMGFFKE